MLGTVGLRLFSPLTRICSSCRCCPAPRWSTITATSGRRPAMPC